jgi:hypothetical protein
MNFEVPIAIQADNGKGFHNRQLIEFHRISTLGQFMEGRDMPDFRDKLREPTRTLKGG